MKIECVTKENFSDALAVYIFSWRDSHREICTEKFLRERNYVGYLREKIGSLFLLTDETAVGIICCKDGVISDLYVLPEKQGRGYGTYLLRFAISRGSEFMLTVLSSNHRAIRLYEHIGFRPTGRRTFLREGLWELEMNYRETENG